MPSYDADKHGFVIRTHLPYITINFLRVETKKVLFSLDGLNKIHASWGCPVQTLSIIGYPPRSKETTNEFAWHWCHLIIHSCDPSWLPGGSWDTPTAVGNILRALEQNLCSPILFPHRTMSNTSNAQHSGVHKAHLGPWVSPSSQKHPQSLGPMVLPSWSVHRALGPPKDAMVDPGKETPTWWKGLHNWQKRPSSGQKEHTFVSLL